MKKLIQIGIVFLLIISSWKVGACTKINIKEDLKSKKQDKCNSSRIEDAEPNKQELSWNSLEVKLEKQAEDLVNQLAADKSNLPVVNAVDDFGADNSGLSLSTKQLQKAVDYCSQHKPYRLFLPKGIYITGTIILKSGVHIEFEEGAKIIGSTNLEDYPVLYPEYKSYTDSHVNKSLFYAEKVDGISMTGNGIIDFKGEHPVYLNSGNNDPLRPFGIRIISSKNIYMNGLMLWNSPQWMQHYLDCENVLLENLTVFNHVQRNNDGLDIDGCKNVYVRNCRIDSGDDAICLKGNGPSACENILIEDCIASSHCNALKLGTETTGGFKNIIYRNCKVVPSASGPHHINGVETTRTAITLIITDGGKMENVWFNNIEATDCLTPIYVTLGNRSRKHTEHTPKPQIGSIENVRISNFKASGAGPISSSVSGLNNSYTLKNITLENIDIELTHPGSKKDMLTNMDELLTKVKSRYPSPNVWGNLPSSTLYLKYISGVHLRNVNIKSKCKDPREKIIIKNCDHVVTQKITNNDEEYKLK